MADGVYKLTDAEGGIQLEVRLKPGMGAEHEALLVALCHTLGKHHIKSCGLQKPSVALERI